jgi:signal transduction histidine kinase
MEIHKNNNLTMDEKTNLKNILTKTLESFNKIKRACDHSIELLDTLSQNVKKLRNYSKSYSNVGDTILSWGKIHLLDNKIKNFISIEQIDIDIVSLNFKCYHSPMLLAQIISNLVKNSIDHNLEEIEDLKIKIYGNKKDELYIEDSGKGIPKNIQEKIFNIGFSTKEDKKISCGIGLATCKNYSIMMNSNLTVESEEGKYTKFILTFNENSSGEIEKSSTSRISIKKEQTPSETRLLANNVVKNAYEKAARSQKLKSEQLKKS